MAISHVVIIFEISAKNEIAIWHKYRNKQHASEERKNGSREVRKEKFLLLFLRNMTKKKLQKAKKRGILVLEREIFLKNEGCCKNFFLFNSLIIR
jgi:hypothetical protein